MVKGTTELEIRSLKFSTALIYPSGISRSPLGVLSALSATCTLSPFLSPSSRRIYATQIETAGEDRGEGDGTEVEREDIEREKTGGGERKRPSCVATSEPRYKFSFFWPFVFGVESAERR